MLFGAICYIHVHENGNWIGNETEVNNHFLLKYYDWNLWKKWGKSTWCFMLILGLSLVAAGDRNPLEEVHIQRGFNICLPLEVARGVYCHRQDVVLECKWLYLSILYFTYVNDITHALHQLCNCCNLLAWCWEWLCHVNKQIYRFLGGVHWILPFTPLWVSGETHMPPSVPPSRWGVLFLKLTVAFPLAAASFRPVNMVRRHKALSCSHRHEPCHS